MGDSLNPTGWGPGDDPRGAALDSLAQSKVVGACRDFSGSSLQAAGRDTPRRAPLWGLPCRPMPGAQRVRAPVEERRAKRTAANPADVQALQTQPCARQPWSGARGLCQAASKSTAVWASISTRRGQLPGGWGEKRASPGTSARPRGRQKSTRRAGADFGAMRIGSPRARPAQLREH